jgi:hypothetical protein
VILAYPVRKYADEAAWISEDELDIGLAEEMNLRSGRWS